MNKLVTFGDSFLAQRRVVEIESRSWIDMVCKENKFDLDGYGYSGTGPYNAILNFLDYDKNFNICFFAWSHIWRPFYMHNKLDKKIDKYFVKYFLNEKIEYVKLQATLQWLDKYLQKNYSHKKFIHFYCFESGYNHLHDVDGTNLYPHIFEHGINIKPCLNDFSNIGDKKEYKNNDPRLLHMIPKVHKLFAKQLNKVLKDKSLNNGDVVEFSLEI